MSVILPAVRRRTNDPNHGFELTDLASAVGVAALMLAVSLTRGDASSPIAVAFAGVLGLLAASDLRRGVIPNRVVYPALGVLLAVSAFRDDLSLVAAVAGMAVASAPFLLLFTAAPGSIGGGDVKMAALVGILVGFPAAVGALVTAVIGAGIAAAVVSWCRRNQPGTTIPYGPFLAAGALLTML